MAEKRTGRPEEVAVHMSLFHAQNISERLVHLSADPRNRASGTVIPDIGDFHATKTRTHLGKLGVHLLLLGKKGVEPVGNEREGLRAAAYNRPFHLARTGIGNQYVSHLRNLIRIIQKH